MHTFLINVHLVTSKSAPGEVHIYEICAHIFGICAHIFGIASSRASFKSSLFLARRADFLQKLSDHVRVVKIDGAEIRADILTKVVSTAVFARLRHFILNVRHRASETAQRLVSFARCPD